MFAVMLLIAATAKAAAPKECPDLSPKLDTCSAYTCKFKHPLTGDMMERRIIGLKDGKCAYVEQMPGGGNMECSYSESMRKAVAKQYKEIADAMASGKSIGFEAHTSSKGSKSKTTIDGKEVDNPLEEALKTGVCKISGYDRK